MTDVVSNSVRKIIEEMHDAYTYSAHDSINTDYAGFAGMALTQFRDALQRPDLKQEDLEGFLRRGMQSHSRNSRNDACWGSFMAQYVSTASNHNAL